MTFDPRFQSQPGAQMMTVSPFVARQWLNHNDFNRVLRSAWVNNLAEQMKKNEYVGGASVISFSKNGRLLNGQHTLSAIVMSDKTYTLTIQYGMPEESFFAYDRGINRTLSDVTKIDAKIVAMLRILNEASIGNYVFGRKMTPSRTLYLFEKCKEAIDFITSIRNWPKTLKPAMIPAAFIAWYYSLPEYDDKTWIKSILRWLAHDEEIINEMAQPQIVNAWIHFVQMNSSALSRGGGGVRSVIFYKAWNLFDHRLMNNRKITAANKDLVTLKIRDIFNPSGASLKLPF